MQNESHENNVLCFTTCTYLSCAFTSSLDASAKTDIKKHSAVHLWPFDLLAQIKFQQLEEKLFSLLAETWCKWSNKDIYDPTKCNHYEYLSLLYDNRC